MQETEDLHLLEIQELTGFLRNDPGFKELKKALAQKGFPADEILLAVFMEDEDWNEYGAIVTNKGDVYRFKRSTRPGEPARFMSFRRVKDIDKFIRYAGPTIEIALRLVATGQLF